MVGVPGKVGQGVGGQGDGRGSGMVLGAKVGGVGLWHALKPVGLCH